MRHVKRFATALLGAATFLVTTAGAALAQYPPSKPPPTDPAVPADPNGIAFTGANIAIGVIILVALVVVGSVLLFAGMRRRAAVAARQN